MVVKYLMEKRNGKIGNFWKRMLKHSDCLYIDKPLFYYDLKSY